MFKKERKTKNEKIICILAAIAIVLSAVPTVFADDADTALKQGDSVELLAADTKYRKYSEGASAITAVSGNTSTVKTYTGQLKTDTDTAYGGNIFFKFNAEKVCDATLTIKFLPNTAKTKRKISCIFESKQISGGIQLQFCGRLPVDW